MNERYKTDKEGWLVRFDIQKTKDSIDVISIYGIESTSLETKYFKKNEILEFLLLEIENEEEEIERYDFEEYIKKRYDVSEDLIKIKFEKIVSEIKEKVSDVNNNCNIYRFTYVFDWIYQYELIKEEGIIALEAKPF